ncbi:protein CUSTOS-like [Ruditapes philippinarum]|uniref:protein CUSTOS-like n=1 Tax=Ruditapes philippinarum TaxID=129788 RepID=UPI00295BF96E|nr:protein CUSTOS-like [Ruditapes philippinarum]
MAAPMATSPETSSSEDEEENAKFKEAVFEIPIGKQVQVKTDFHQTNDKERIPSKRPDKDISDADQFDNAYNTTPGFRKHVSKKLSEALDSVIDTSCEYFGKSVDNAEEDSGKSVS